MKLTPLDIHHKEFRHSLRGYNEEEVDAVPRRGRRRVRAALQGEHRPHREARGRQRARPRLPADRGHPQHDAGPGAALRRGDRQQGRAPRPTPSCATPSSRPRRSSTTRCQKQAGHRQRAHPHQAGRGGVPRALQGAARGQASLGQRDQPARRRQRAARRDRRGRRRRRVRAPVGAGRRTRRRRLRQRRAGTRRRARAEPPPSARRAADDGDASARPAGLRVRAERVARRAGRDPPMEPEVELVEPGEFTLPGLRLVRRARGRRRHRGDRLALAWRRSPST